MLVIFHNLFFTTENTFLQQQSYVMKNGTVKYWCWFKCEQYPTPFSVQCAAGYSSNVLTLKVKVTILTKHFQSYQHQRKKTNSNQTIVSYLFSFSRRKIVDVAFCLTLMSFSLITWKKKLRNYLRITWPFGEEIPLIGCPHLTTLPDHWREAPPTLNRLHAIGWRNLSHAHQKPSDACDRGKCSVSEETTNEIPFFLEGFCFSKDVTVNFCFFKLTVMNSTDITVFFLFFVFTSETNTSDGDYFYKINHL